MRGRPPSHGHTSGGSLSPTYVSWQTMKQRCLNPNATKYHLWGGKGVTIYEPWLDFATFLADMGERPEGTSLDRYPDPDGNYEPGNVRWATDLEQRHNRKVKK